MEQTNDKYRRFFEIHEDIVDWRECVDIFFLNYTLFVSFLSYATHYFTTDSVSNCGMNFDFLSNQRCQLSSFQGVFRHSNRAGRGPAEAARLLPHQAASHVAALRRTVQTRRQNREDR